MRASTATIAILVGLTTTGCGDSVPPVPQEEGSTGTTTDALATTSTGSTGPIADGESTSGPVAGVTYHGHVRALFERHCVGCHQPGNIGPFSMTNYEEVHALREAIVLSVEEGTMPPWLAAPDCQDYLGDTTLTGEEAELIREWVDDGGPEGDPGDYVAPEIPPVPELSRVDLTLELPEPYEPTLKPDDYRCFLIDWPYDDTVYVSGFRAVPDQLHMVHHMIAFAIEPDQVAEYEALDAAEPEAGYTCFGGPGGEIDPGDPDTAGKWLGSWAPGGLAGDFPEGTGIPVPPGSRVVLQVHYNTGAGEVVPDRSGMSFKIDEEVDKPAAMMLWADPSWLAGGMPIPAGDPAVTHSFQLDPTPFMGFVTDVIPDGSPFRIYSSVIHMHTRGSRGQTSIVRGGGDPTCLLEIPRYDFNWQQAYRFSEPVLFEPGDQLRLACEWNNEASEQGRNWGDGTDDEMCLGVFYVTTP